MFEFLIIAVDVPGTREARLATRPAHFENIKRMTAEGKVTWGGAMLNDVPKDDSAESMDFAGSAMTIMAKDKEEAFEIFKNDPYTKAGVWDAEKVQIYAFKAALRVPLEKK